MDIKNNFDFIEKCSSKFKQGGLRLLGNFKQDKEFEPLITIITTVKNGENYLEECILSLKQQTYKNYEHIIIDANSSD